MLVYLLKNKTTGMGYVGITTQRLEARLAYHRSSAPTHVRVKRRTVLWQAICKYGWEDFDVQVLETCMDDLSLRAAETRWILELGTLAPAGLNMNTGGFLRHPSAEVRARISATQKGRPCTPERREKLRQALAGRTIAWADKIAATKRGQKATGRTAEALAEGRANRWADPGARVRASAANPNRKIPTEVEPQVLQLRAEGWTQQRLAERFGVQQAAISKLLRRRR